MTKEFIAFLRDAYMNNLCDEYKDEIRRCHGDRLRLISLSMRQQSIPYIATKIKSGIITRDYLLSYKDYANGYVLNNCDGVNGYTYALYIDNKGENTTQCDVTHFVWCDMTYNVDLTKCQTLYISNSSNITLRCKGFNNMVIYLFDDACVNIADVGETNRIIIYKYSDDCVVNRTWQSSDGDKRIKEFRKRLIL